MKQAIVLCAIIFFAAGVSPAYAGGLVWNPSETMGAYVDYVIPRDHPLVDFAPDSKTIYFFNSITGERYRGTYYRFGNFLTDYTGANVLTIVEWLDDSTLLVEASFTGDWSWIEGTETYLVSTDGKVEFTGFENLTGNSESEIDPAYLRDDFTYTWDCMDVAAVIPYFMDQLCGGQGTIDPSWLPEGINKDPDIALYGSFEDFMGCGDIIQYVMPREDGDYDAVAVWHSYVFRYGTSGVLSMVEYTAPQDL